MDGYVFAEIPAPAGSPLLFLLHGTGGDEHDLLDLGRQVAPGAHLIAPRGDVSENGAPRFFRRLGPGAYDMADLARATAKLAGFIATHADRLGAPSVAALGYSNGANVLASVLFEGRGRIERAVLMHPLIPFVPADQPALAGRHVLITAGRADPIAPFATTEALAAYFARQGATAELEAHAGGHELRREEIDAAKRFLDC